MAKFLSVAFALTFAAVATSAAASPINTFGIWTGTDSCAPCSGLGTNVFSDGFAAVNSFTNLFTFTGVSTDVGLGEIFVLGTLTFRNGQVSGNGNPVPTYFDLHIGTTSPDAAFNQTIDLRVNYQGNPNVSNPNAAADYIWITSPTGDPQFGQALRVFEDNRNNIPSEGSIQLLGRINSLHYEGFGALLTPDTAFVTATSAPNDFTPVPEPATVALLGTGIAGIFLSRRRQNAKT